jgi:fatty acid/phospholipid biosynthesis enzyme
LAQNNLIKLQPPFNTNIKIKHQNSTSKNIKKTIKENSRQSKIYTFAGLFSTSFLMFIHDLHIKHSHQSLTDGGSLFNIIDHHATDNRNRYKCTSQISLQTSQRTSVLRGRKRVFNMVCNNYT